MRALLAGVFLVCSPSVLAQTVAKDFECVPGKTPFHCYSMLTGYAALKCTVSAQIDLKRAAQCEEESTAAIRPVYSQVLASLKDKPKVEELLKDHYAAWRSHMKMTYTASRREVDSNSSRVEEKLQRLAIELE